MMNYKIGQRSVPKDSGRFLAAMSELVRVLSTLLLMPVKLTTTTLKIYFKGKNETQ